MSNHVHCMLSANEKKYLMLTRIGFAARSHKRNSEYQFWTHEHHAIELITHDFTTQKLGHIHENPVG